MPRCAKCGGHTERARRTPLERVIFRTAYRCQSCKHRTRHVSASVWWSSTWRFVFSRYAVCVKCGTRNVRSSHKRDPILDHSKHPLSLIQALFLLPRKQCPYCRLEYFDVRPVAPTEVMS